RLMVNRWHETWRRANVRPCSDEHAVSTAIAADDLGEVDAAESRAILIRRAMEIMQSDFEEATWRACWEHVANDRPAAEVAAELGCSVNVVYVSSVRVIRRLKQELGDAWS